MKMKKIFGLALVAAMTATMFVGCGKSSDDKKDKKDTPKADYTLLSDGVLNVGCEVGYPPFEDFANDGTTPVGFDVDIISEVADRLGLKVNIINTAWDGIFEGIDVNYDVVCSACTITSDRLKTMIFSSPYIKNYQAVVLKKGDTRKIESFKDLDKLVISLQKETTSDVLMSDYKSTGTIDVEIVANEKVTSCFSALSNGEVDAVVVDSTVADGYLASHPDDYILAYKDESEAEEFGIAIGKNNTKLQAAINEVLADMEAEGYIQETYDYWFGKDNN